MKFKSFSAHILALLGLSEWSKVEDKNSITVEEAVSYTHLVEITPKGESGCYW